MEGGGCAEMAGGKEVMDWEERVLFLLAVSLPLPLPFIPMTPLLSLPVSLDPFKLLFMPAPASILGVFFPPPVSLTFDLVPFVRV